MMYFCPCSCNDPIDPETEESTFVALPRNLSYVQESYLDRYSVSARFVHNPKIERTIQHQQSQERRANVEDETYSLLSAIRAQDFPVKCDANYDSVTNSGLYSSAFKVDSAGDGGFHSKDCGKTTGNVLPSQSSPFSASSLLEPASRVASRLTSLLHSPPNESMDFARGDVGTSVDGDEEGEAAALLSDPLTSVDPQTMEVPASLGQEMDRGGELPRCADNDEFYNDDDRERDGTCDVAVGRSPEDSESKQESDNHVILSDPYDKPYGLGGKSNFPKSDLHSSVRRGDEAKTRGNNGSYGSPDSDVLSEEGVFVNMDDLDSTTEKSTTVSETSDDTCVSADSMFLSPEEGELEEEVRHESTRKMSLEEAISRAASDLRRMSADVEAAEGSQAEEEDGRMTLRSVGRGSPVRGISGLKIKITDQSDVGTSTQFSGSSSTLSESPIYPEHEFNFSRVELRKSSSLKSNKTPPGTPHRKKVVRFADAMGLDLESVRHVLNMESPPKIPASAMADLKDGLSEDGKEIGSKYLCPCFEQPGALDGFMAKVLSQKVSLENAIITEMTITGFVRVANIAYHKSVRVRYTHNSWSTFHDIAASYVQHSCDGPTDRFSFSIVAPIYFVPGSRLEFAVSFNAGGTEYWDNNDGKNYVFECFAKTVPTESEMAWLHFL